MLLLNAALSALAPLKIPPAKCSEKLNLWDIASYTIFPPSPGGPLCPQPIIFLVIFGFISRNELSRAV